MAATTGAVAQNKPEQGSFGVEVQFNPFDQNGQTFKLDGLKFRYFLTDQDAIRVKMGVDLNHSNYTDGDEAEPGDKSKQSSFKNTYGDFSLDFGYERHFSLHKRLDLYAGGSAGFTRHFASSKLKMYDRQTNSIFNGQVSNGAITSSEGDVKIENMLDAVNERAYWGVNAAVFTGLDLYLYKGLYVGTELGLRLQTQKSSPMHYQGMMDGGNISYDKKSTDESKTVTLKTYIEPTLRLGWTF